DDGFVLWYVLACTSGLALLAGATMAAGALALRSEVRNLSFLQCKAIGLALARSAEAALAQGTALPASAQRNVAGHPVVVTSSVSGGQVHVSIRVTEGAVSDTMSFVYDTISHGVVSWQDNGPRSSME
ncbi:hypothetical protein, partial [Alicyclobacillus sendaiensis]